MCPPHDMLTGTHARAVRPPTHVWRCRCWRPHTSANQNKAHTHRMTRSKKKNGKSRALPRGPGYTTALPLAVGAQAVPTTRSSPQPRAVGAATDRATKLGEPSTWSAFAGSPAALPEPLDPDVAVGLMDVQMAARCIMDAGARQRWIDKQYVVPWRECVAAVRGTPVPPGESQRCTVAELMENRPSTAGLHADMIGYMLWQRMWFYSRHMVRTARKRRQHGTPAGGTLPPLLSLAPPRANRRPWSKWRRRAPRRAARRQVRLRLAAC